MNCIDLFLFNFKLCPASSLLFQPTPFLLFRKCRSYRSWVISQKFYNNRRDLLHNFRSYLCIMLFLKKKNVPIWRIYRSIGIRNVHMYHEYNIVWFNIVVHARILSDSLQRHDMVWPFILISSFSPRRLPAEKLLQKRCSRSIAFESRLLKAANVVTYFTTRKEITTPRRSHALPLLLTATTFIRCRICDTLQTIVIAKSKM